MKHQSPKKRKPTKRAPKRKRKQKRSHRPTATPPETRQERQRREQEERQALIRDNADDFAMLHSALTRLSLGDISEVDWLPELRPRIFIRLAYRLDVLASAFGHASPRINGREVFPVKISLLRLLRAIRSAWAY